MHDDMTLEPRYHLANVARDQARQRGHHYEMTAHASSKMHRRSTHRPGKKHPGVFDRHPRFRNFDPAQSSERTIGL